MTITHIASASVAASKITIPTHEAGDLLLMGVAKAVNGTITVPAGWTLVSTKAVTGRYTIAYKIATAPGTLSGTWKGANGLMVNVYRGATGIGDASIVYTASGTTITWPARTLQVTDGTSVVVGIGYAGLTASGLTLPLGQVARIGSNFQSCWDTGVGVTAYAAQTSTISNQPKYVATLELKA